MSPSCLLIGCEFKISTKFHNSHDIKRFIIFFDFQKTNRGRITFNDFKNFIVNLKAWQGVFKMHTKEKAGILRAERLRDALYDVGFQLSTEILSILILKYMRRDGTLRLGDFVSAILHLTLAFGEFYFNRFANHNSNEFYSWCVSFCCFSRNL